MGFGVLGLGTGTGIGFGGLKPPILFPFASVWQLYITNTPIVSKTLKANVFILK